MKWVHTVFGLRFPFGKVGITADGRCSLAREDSNEELRHGVKKIVLHNVIAVVTSTAYI